MTRLLTILVVCLLCLHRPLTAVDSWDWTVSYPDRSQVTASTTYEVGPGRAYANPRDIPWLSLKPGDQVLIHHRSTPYTDMVFIGAQGAPGRWITIRGIPGPGGERPVFDGANAVMPAGTGANEHTQSAGMFIICKPAGYAYGYKPSYLHISGFTIRNVRPPSQITDMYGAVRPWSRFVAGIYVSPGSNIAVTDCEITACSIGIFVNSQDAQYSQSRQILVRDNYIHGNGVDGEAGMHNAYTEAIGTVYEYNYFGSPISGSAGDNIKERSAGIIIRYNYIQDGVNLISLRDPQSNAVYEGEAVDPLGGRLASQAYIYGNILVARNPTVYQDAPVIVGHGDGRYGDGRHIRDGQIAFYGNRVVSTLDAVAYRLSTVPLFALINTRAPTTVQAVNNLFHANRRTAGGTAAEMALFFWQGSADWQSNLINAYRTVHAAASDGGLAVGTRFDGGGLGGLAASSADPGFVDPASGNYLTTPSSPFASLNAPWPAAAVARGLAPQDEPVVVPFGRRGTPAAPEIAVSRAGAAVADGSTSTITGTVAGTATSLTYAIANTGTSALSIGGLGTVAGVNCSAAVITAPAATVAAGGATELVLSVTPTASGAWSFPVSFATDDADENPTDWTVSGTADPAPAPVIAVSRGGATIAHGSTDSVAGTMAGSATTLTYAIGNTGGASLRIGTPGPISGSSCSVAIATAPAGTVAPGAATSLALTVTPSGAGAWSCAVTLTGADGDEILISWTTSGNAAAAPGSAAGGGVVGSGGGLGGAIPGGSGGGGCGMGGVAGLLLTCALCWRRSRPPRRR